MENLPRLTCPPKLGDGGGYGGQETREMLVSGIVGAVLAPPSSDVTERSPAGAVSPKADMKGGASTAPTGRFRQSRRIRKPPR